jgi:aspartate aminotransferase
VVVPGKPFGDDQCIRISCASSKEKILDGLSRLEKGILNYYF